MEEIPLYIFIFIAIYSQVFLGMILLEEWENIFTENAEEDPEALAGSGYSCPLLE
jgi:hypothetical protein